MTSLLKIIESRHLENSGSWGIHSLQNILYVSPSLDVLFFWFFIKEYFSFSFKQKLIAHEHERQMSKKFYFFYFSKLMSTRVTNFRYSASLGGESGSMAKQSLMSWGSFSSTHLTGDQMGRSLTPSTCFCGEAAPTSALCLWHTAQFLYNSLILGPIRASACILPDYSHPSHRLRDTTSIAPVSWSPNISPFIFFQRSDINSNTHISSLVAHWLPIPSRTGKQFPVHWVHFCEVNKPSFYFCHFIFIWSAKSTSTCQYWRNVAFLWALLKIVMAF